MSCSRAFEIDLAAFLAQPRDTEWTDFREHYPLCRACAAEVLVWTVLGAELSATEHPAPDLLLRWVDAPDTLDPVERTRTRAHLDRCRSCADELRALDRSVLAGQDGASDRAAASRRDRRSPARSGRPDPGRRPSPLRTVGRVLWNPAFPYAALIVLALLPLLRGEMGRRSEPTRAAATAERDAARGAASPSEPLVAAAPPEPRLAASDEPVAPAAQAGSAPPREAPPETHPAAEELRLRKAPAPLADAERRSEEARAGPSGRRLSDSVLAPADAPRAAAAAPRTGEPLPGGSSAELGLRWRDADAREPRRLLVSLPASLRGSASLLVRIRSGDRALEERVRVPPGAEEIEIGIPPGWLAESPRAVEVRTPRGDLAARGEIDAR